MIHISVSPVTTTLRPSAPDLLVQLLDVEEQEEGRPYSLAFLLVVAAAAAVVAAVHGRHGRRLRRTKEEEEALRSAGESTIRVDASAILPQ